jgi:nitrogen fixation-related uncharacterized protein
MYEQVYSIAQESYSLFNALVVPVSIVLVIVGGAIGILWDRYKKKQYKNMLFTIIFALFVVFQLRFFVSTSLIGYNQHNRLVDILESSSAKEVVGEIREFIPRNTSKKVQESFIVEGVKFTYSRALRTGAYVPKNKNLQEGQFVRISYVYDKNWGMNLILKLEIKNEKK